MQRQVLRGLLSDLDVSYRTLTKSEASLCSALGLPPPEEDSAAATAAALAPGLRTTPITANPSPRALEAENATGSGKTAAAKSGGKEAQRTSSEREAQRAAARKSGSPPPYDALVGRPTFQEREKERARERDRERERELERARRRAPAVGSYAPERSRLAEREREFREWERESGRDRGREGREGREGRRLRNANARASPPRTRAADTEEGEIVAGKAAAAKGVDEKNGKAGESGAGSKRPAPGAAAAKPAQKKKAMATRSSNTNNAATARKADAPAQLQETPRTPASVGVAAGNASPSERAIATPQAADARGATSPDTTGTRQGPESAPAPSATPAAEGAAVAPAGQKGLAIPVAAASLGATAPSPSKGGQGRRRPAQSDGQGAIRINIQPAAMLAAAQPPVAAERRPSSAAATTPVTCPGAAPNPLAGPGLYGVLPLPQQPPPRAHRDPRPYASPLLLFGSARLLPHFRRLSSGAGLTSPTYCHAVEPNWPLCPFEVRVPFSPGRVQLKLHERTPLRVGGYQMYVYMTSYNRSTSSTLWVYDTCRYQQYFS